MLIDFLDLSTQPCEKKTKNLLKRMEQGWELAAEWFLTYSEGRIFMETLMLDSVSQFGFHLGDLDLETPKFKFDSHRFQSGNVFEIPIGSIHGCGKQRF